MKKTINKSGFTLIELLAVIIILGVLMIIAIPSVTEYISNSRKEAYVTSVKQMISGVRNKVNSLEFPFLDTSITYYVPLQCVNLEKGGDSPFGEWEDAYAVVTYDGSGYNYYFAGYDSSGHGTTIISEENLTKDFVNPGMDNLNVSVGVEREKVLVMDKTTCDPNNMQEYVATEKLDVESGEIVDAVNAELLIDKVSVGDFVNYDAGTWTTTVAIPTEAGKIGGSVSGVSRNKTVNCVSDTNSWLYYQNDYSGGWRVLGIKDDVITLIHAGTPECFMAGRDYDNEHPLSSIDFSHYVNSSYATSAHNVSIDNFNNSNSESYHVGYYISSGNYDTTTLMLLNGSKYFFDDTEYSTLLSYDESAIGHYWTVNEIAGIRPIVKLKAGVKTSGKTIDAYGNEAWNLVG